MLRHPLRSLPASTRDTRTIGRHDLWVNEYIIRYDDQTSLNVVGIMEFRDDKVVRERDLLRRALGATGLAGTVGRANGRVRRVALRLVNVLNEPTHSSLVLHDQPTASPSPASTETLRSTPQRRTSNDHQTARRRRPSGVGRVVVSHEDPPMTNSEVAAHIFSEVSTGPHWAAETRRRRGQRRRQWPLAVVEPGWM